jgi:hypothetical protein
MGEAIAQMNSITPRSATDEEIALVQAVLRVVPTSDATSISRPEVLTVISECACGCRSIGFVGATEGARDTTRLLADGMAMLSNGEAVDIRLLGDQTTIHELEIINHGIARGDLPSPDSVMTFEDAGRRLLSD